VAMFCALVLFVLRLHNALKSVISAIFCPSFCLSCVRLMHTVVTSIFSTYINLSEVSEPTFYLLCAFT